MKSTINEIKKENGPDTAHITLTAMYTNKIVNNTFFILFCCLICLFSTLLSYITALCQIGRNASSAVFRLLISVL